MARQRSHAAGQDLVAAGDDGRGTRRHPEQLLRGRLPVLRGQRPGQRDRLVGDAPAGDRILHAGDALANRPQVERPGDERDPPVSQIQEVLHRGLDPRPVIVAHHAGSQLGWNFPVHYHDRCVYLSEPVQRGLPPFAGQRQDHAVDPAGLEEPDVRRVQIRVVLGVHQQHRVAGGAEHGFRPGGDGRHQRVGDVADDPADRQRRAAPQALGQEVRLVLKLADSLEDTLAHISADIGVAGQDSRDRGDGDVRKVGDLAHAGAAAPRVRPSLIVVHSKASASGPVRSRTNSAGLALCAFQ